MWIMIKIHTLFVLCIMCVNGQSYLDLQYRIYNQDTGWSNDTNYECSEMPLVINEDGVTLYLRPQHSDHTKCVCRAIVLSEPHQNTDLRVWEDTQAEEFVYPTSEWTNPETGELVMEMERGAIDTWLVLNLSGGRSLFSTPITFSVFGDFYLICQAQESPISTSTPSIFTLPSEQNNEDTESTEDKNESFLMMQVVVAALLSTGAVVMVTVAVAILCCYKRHKNRKSNRIVSEKVPPQQPFMNITPEQYRRQYSNVRDNNNTEFSCGTEHLYDNNIPSNSAKTIRKTLSFRDTMYANFTAIVAAFGQARENSRKSKQREFQNQDSTSSNEPRTYDNVEAVQNNQNQITDGIQYAQIDISRLMDVEPKQRQEQKGEQDVQLHYADLMF